MAAHTPTRSWHKHPDTLYNPVISETELSRFMTHLTPGDFIQVNVAVNITISTVSCHLVLTLGSTNSQDKPFLSHFSAQFDDCVIVSADIFPYGDWSQLICDTSDTWRRRWSWRAHLITKSSLMFSVKTKSLSENNKILRPGPSSASRAQFAQLFAFIDRKIWKLGPTTVNCHN